jgi:hypothetical protein
LPEVLVPVRAVATQVEEAAVVEAVDEEVADVVIGDPIKDKVLVSHTNSIDVADTSSQ